MSQKPFYGNKRLMMMRDRAAQRAGRLGAHHHGFLHQEAAEILADRLAATNRSFNSLLLLHDGPFADLIDETFRHMAPNLKVPLKPVTGTSLEPESADLIISVLDGLRANDVARLFARINLALKPDGLFMAALPLAGTLQEFQSAMMQAELEVTGGAAMRFDLFPEIRQVGDLLQRSGFKLPVCDVEERLVRYSKLNGLIEDLRGTGMSSAIGERQPEIGGKVRNRLAEIYARDFADADGKLRATVNIGLLSGWKEHDSQQKPLKPGAAKNNLKDFL